jgi:hypothetical protein
MEVSGQLHAPDAFRSGKEPRYPFDGRLGGSQSRSERDGEEKKNVLLVTGSRISVVHPVAQSLY